MFRNPGVLVMFIVFPAVALVMTEFVAKSNDLISNNIFVTMMAAVFAGMGLISGMASILAEDIERKSLRFLVMAGVKPYEYLLGTGGFILLAGSVTSVLFALIGDFTGTEWCKFLVVLILSVAASIILGASIGILAKNQQAATAIGMPVAVILGFTPMIASFNETVEKVAGILYTQQLNVIVNDFSASLPKALAVVGVNILLLIFLFIWAYRRNGLKI